MPTKFVVLWLQTIFISTENGKEEESELVIQAEKLDSLEEALIYYNQKVSNPVNAQVMILVPLKDFNRSKTT
jgi:hypothetical protein